MRASGEKKRRLFTVRHKIGHGERCENVREKKSKTFRSPHAADRFSYSPRAAVFRHRVVYIRIYYNYYVRVHSAQHRTRRCNYSGVFFHFPRNVVKSRARVDIEFISLYSTGLSGSSRKVEWKNKKSIIPLLILFPCSRKYSYVHAVLKSLY